MIVIGWQARLYPTREQACRLNQWAGSLRFLWNRLLEREKAEYQATGKFLWRKQLQPIAVGMKRQGGMEWLADLPAHAVLDTVARMDAALRRMVNERKAGRECGFPRAKKKFVNDSGIYCVGQATAITGRQARVPKIGSIRLRGGDLPEGRLLAARIWRDGERWMLSAQFECARVEPLPPSDITVGVDLGVSTLVTAFDGAAFEEVDAPKHLRKAQKRLRRAQRALSRRQIRLGAQTRSSARRRRDPSQSPRAAERFAAPIESPADSQGRCFEDRDAEREGHGPEQASRSLRGGCRDVPAPHLLRLQGRLAGATDRCD